MDAQDKQSVYLLAAGSAGTATGAAALPQIDIGIQVETHTGKVDFNGAGLFHELFVHAEFQTLDFKVVITVFRLIQSHCKGRAASAAGVQKDPNGGGFFPLEIVIDLRFRSISQLNHCNALLIL